MHIFHRCKYTDTITMAWNIHVGIINSQIIIIFWDIFYNMSHNFNLSMSRCVVFLTLHPSSIFKGPSAWTILNVQTWNACNIWHQIQNEDKQNKKRKLKI